VPVRLLLHGKHGRLMDQLEAVPRGQALQDDSALAVFKEHLCGLIIYRIVIMIMISISS